MNSRELYNETTEVNNLTEFSFTQLDKANINIEYCEAIINQSKQAIGYALNLAKTFIYPDDAKAFNSWLVKMDISESTAKLHIRYYKAQNLYTEVNMVPDSSFKFSALSGELSKIRLITTQ